LSLPSGWTISRLGDVAVEVRNGISTRPDGDSGIPILRISSVRPMMLNDSDVRFLPAGTEAIRSFELRADDLLFTRYNGNPSLVGVCARVTHQPDVPLVYPDKLIRVRLNQDLAIPAFVEKAVHVGQSRAFIDDKTKTSAGQVGISGADLKDVPLPLPPVNEQRRIVAKLEALQARSRRAREALDAVPPLLEKLRQSILAAAFRGDLTKDWRAQNPNPEPASALLARIRAERRTRWEEAELAKLKAKGKAPTDDRWKAKYKEPEPADTTGLPELPEGWCWASLETLAWDSGYGTSEKCGYDGDGVAVLRIPNIARGSIHFGDVKHALSALPTGELLLAPGDLLIVRTNGSRDLIGRAAVVSNELAEPTSFASYLIRFRLLADGVLPDWVSRYWQSPFVRSLIEGHAASSAGQYNVSLGELAGCPVPVAPVEERRVALDRLGSALDHRLLSENTLKGAIGQLAAVDRAILAKAFRGELVPQNPTDEPADALLARLRAADPDETPRQRSRRAKAAE